MGIFSKSGEKDELVLVFDVGSGAVGGALFWAQGSGIPKIIFSVREPIVLKEGLEAGQLLSASVKALEIVANRIHLSGLGAPERIFCVLSSPWYISQTRIINLKKNIPFTVTEKLAGNLMQKETNLFKEEQVAKYGDKIRTIEIKNIKTTLNGYETPAPFGKKAKELEIAVFVSIGGERELEAMESAILPYFHLSPKFISSTLASFAVVRSMHMERENFLLVDVGGEVTDISVIKKNMLRQSATFPLGYNFFIRGLASRLSCSVSEARSLFSLLKDGHAEKKLSDKIAPVLNQLKKEWLEKFQDSLANLADGVSVPATVYLYTDKGMAGFFSQMIQAEQFSQYSLTESKFKVVFLGTEPLHGTAEFTKEAIREPFSIIDSVYINRFLIKI